MNSEQPPPPPYHENKIYPDVTTEFTRPNATQTEQTAIVIGTTPDAGSNINYSSPFPMRVTCPLCQTETVTRTKPVAGLLTYLSGLCLCIFCCWPCICVPCCVDMCKDVEHSCGHCRRRIGLYKRM